MKKILIIICLLGGCAFCAAGILISSYSPSANTVIEDSNSPTLYSQIDVDDYVSLPVLEGLSVTEASVEEGTLDWDTAEEQAIEKILGTASELSAATQNCTLLVDMTISRDGQFLDEYSDYLIGYGYEDLPETLKEAFEGIASGASIQSLRVDSYLGYEDVDLNIQVKHIYNLEYPFTDEYIKNHTEYTTLEDMIRALIRNSEDASRTSQLETTMEGLLDAVLAKTTFTKIPSSLCDEELAVLNEDGDDHYYNEAETSVKRILLIKSINSRYSLVSESEAESRLNTWLDTNGEVSEYASERQKILLCEDDVVNYLYKTIEIISDNETESAEAS